VLLEEESPIVCPRQEYCLRRRLISLEGDAGEDDDELAFVDATGDDRVAEIGSNGATGDAGDVDAISSKGFLLSFFDMEQRSEQM